MVFLKPQLLNQPLFGSAQPNCSDHCYHSSWDQFKNARSLIRRGTGPGVRVSTAFGCQSCFVCVNSLCYYQLTFAVQSQFDSSMSCAAAAAALP
jgi:hypothetical protein